MMKKKLLYIGAFLITTALFNSCNALDEICEYCEINVYDGPVIIRTEQGGEYCGDELIAFKAIPDYTDPITGFISKAECEN